MMTVVAKLRRGRPTTLPKSAFRSKRQNMISKVVFLSILTTLVKWSLVNDINKAFKAFLNEEKTEQDKFDIETKHGVDLDKEKEWEEKYGVQ